MLQNLHTPTYGGIVITGYPRVNKVTDEVKQANYEAHRVLHTANPNSVWKNYDLIGVQAKTTNDSHYPNFFLANYVIESCPSGKLKMAYWIEG